MRRREMQEFVVLMTLLALAAAAALAYVAAVGDWLEAPRHKVRTSPQAVRWR